MPKKINFTKKQKETISGHYVQGKSISAIARLNDVSNRTIQRVLEFEDVWEKGKYPKNRKRKYARNSNFFDSISSWESAYWLGFIAADGCVKLDKYGRHYLDIRLAEKDIEHLKLFSKHLLSEIPINVYTRKKTGYRSCCFNVCDEILVKGLIDKGIEPRKTFTLTWPNFDDKFDAAFMLGYFDGDGCWTKSNNFPKFNVVGNKEFVTEYQSRLCQKTNLIPSKIQKLKNVYGFEYTGDKFKAIGDFLYTDSKFCLRRKYVRFLDIWNEYRK